jgi:hypothetical protein
MTAHDTRPADPIHARLPKGHVQFYLFGSAECLGHALLDQPESPSVPVAPGLRVAELSEGIAQEL